MLLTALLAIPIHGTSTFTYRFSVSRVACHAYSHAPPEKLDSGIDFDLLFSRAVKLSPSFVIDGFLRSSDRAWSMYSVACVLLDPTTGMESDLVTSTFRSPGGQFIFQFLIYLIADSLKYPSRTDEIVTFLISENSLRTLGLIFTDPVKIMIVPFHAYELQRFNLWDAPSEEEGELLPERWVSLEEAWRKVKGVAAYVGMNRYPAVLEECVEEIVAAVPVRK